MSRHSKQRGASERGAAILVTAVAMIVILVLAALVVDVGRERATARQIQSAADLAALAAAADLGNGDPTAACQSAVKYLATNLPTLASIDPVSFCGQGLAATVCNGGSASQATPTATVGGVTATIHYPVPDSEIADGRIVGPRANDASACKRLRIVLADTRQGFFSGIAGKQSLSVTRSATVAAKAGSGHRAPALWLLDPTGCTSLSVTGGSRVTVGTPTISGLITVDSDGSDCSSNQNTLSTGGTGSTLAAVPTTGTDPGVIGLHALVPGATTCSPPACNPSDVSNGAVTPQPTFGEQVTRAPVDWRFNCKASYPDFHGVPIAPCTSGAPAYVDRLAAAVGTGGSPGATYTRWTSRYSCNPSGSITVTGNWWVDCSTFAIGNGTNITFAGGNVVTDGALNMTGGTLRFNTANPTSMLPAGCDAPTVVTPCTASSSASAAMVWGRSGAWKITGGTVTANHTAVFVRNGHLQLSGNPPSWSAPTDGPFAGLAFWDEYSSNKFQINGGSGANLSGVFFLPEATPFTLAGGGTWGQQGAQFIAYQLVVTGGSTLTVAPDGNAVTVPVSGGLLIR